MLRLASLLRTDHLLGGAQSSTFKLSGHKPHQRSTAHKGVRRKQHNLALASLSDEIAPDDR